jgi:hypothetical protein
MAWEVERRQEVGMRAQVCAKVDSSQELSS